MRSIWKIAVPAGLAALLLLATACGGAVKKSPERPEEGPAPADAGAGKAERRGDAETTRPAKPVDHDGMAEATGTDEAAGADASDPMVEAEWSTRRTMPEPYRLVVGDTVRVTIILGDQSQISYKATLRPDGYISIPPVDDVKAAGLRLDQLEEALRLAISNMYRSPVVNVTLHYAQGLQVYVGGEVSLPRSVPIHSPTTIYAAIVQAGGFTDFAKTSEILILRKHSPTDRTILELDLSKPHRLRDPKQNVYLQPGDLVLVPRTGVGKAITWARQYVYNTLMLNLDVGAWFYLDWSNFTTIDIDD